MRSPMDEKTFMTFYKNTVLGYSNNLQRHICRSLEEQHRITFEEQRSLLDPDKIIYFESKKDLRGILSQTTVNKDFIGFYEHWEFVKLYKYSVPLFYQFDTDKNLTDILTERGILEFNESSFQPEFVLNTSLLDAKPIYLKEQDRIFIKFTLQKTYVTSESFEQTDYRYPIVLYFDLPNQCMEIRYDAIKYTDSFDSEIYEKLVVSCIDWTKKELGLSLYTCEHTDAIKIVNDKQNENVKMYKQMMQMSSGGAAELTAAESSDYVLPFIGEIRELIDENEDLFNEAPEIKQLLTQYLNDKEATASYPYIYVKWVKPVESQSYIVKITFDYLNRRYTLLQHITGGCKDLGMERMNDAIKYLCESGSFAKGEKI